MWQTVGLTVAVSATPVASAGCSHSERYHATENALLKRQQENKRLRPLLDRILPLRTQCVALDPVPTVSIRGKVLVWAADLGHRSEQIEPAQLRADSLDEPITVFLYRSLRHDRGWFFTNANDEMQTVLRYPAYRQDIEICAVYWPEAKVAGRTILEGGEPPMSGGEPQAEHGTLPDLKEWLNRQPAESR